MVSLVIKQDWTPTKPSSFTAQMVYIMIPVLGCPSYKISQNANPDLKWEQTAMLNIGLDFSVLDSRLGGRIEWYNKKTSDMLYTYPVPTPPYLYNKIMANVGDMRNTGIELSLNADAIRTKDFDWNISLNLAHNENEVTRLSNDVFTMDKILLGDVFIRGGSSSGTQRIGRRTPYRTILRFGL